MLSPYFKRNVLRIIPFGLVWLGFSLIYSLLERGLLGGLDHYPATGNPYDFRKTIFITSGCAFVIGLLVGTVEVLYLNTLFRQKSFLKKIIYKTFIYLAIIVSFLFLLTLIYNSIELKQSILSKPVWKNVLIFFNSFAFWSVEVYIAAILGVSLFYTEVSENLGESVLRNFFTGKYHAPIEEERIFMFLDMKSSTTIAEDIGHVRYFEMLKEYFADLTSSIVKYSGEIYQYVGDEIVVSWKINNGLQNNNCIRCFYDMEAAIKKQDKKYKERFGVMPTFKAGYHFGSVTTGEIGVIKKDIIFTGDVLNTTARIQGLCNAYNVDILVSQQLLERLDLRTDFEVRALGENELRGRDEKIRLYTILPL